jgi:hypothetical protein
MAGITAAQAQTQLDAYLEAELKVLSGQSYEIHGRRLTRANLEEIQNGIKLWSDRLVALSSTRTRARTIVPAG